VVLGQFGEKAWEFSMFRASLITDALPPLWVSRMWSEGGEGSHFPTPLSSHHHHHHHLYTPESHPTHGFPLLYCHVQGAGGVAANAATVSAPSTARGQKLHENGSSEGVGVLEGSSSHTPPPFPELAHWVLDIARGGNPLATQLSVRSWKAITKHLTFASMGGGGAPIPITFITHLTLHISGGRYCHRIGREHKSNNVFWGLDFLLSKAWQGCLDPECKGYRFLVDIPNQLMPQQVPSDCVLITN